MRRIACVVLVVPLSADADVLEVPGQYPTIQLAVDAANPGDEIVVAPGSYAGFESFADIVVRGSGAEPEDTTVTGPIEVFDRFSVSNLTLDGGFSSPGFDQIVIHRCVIQAVGVNIQNCELIVSESVFKECVGGAVTIADCTASFTDCLFSKNTTDQSGGAISCSDSTLTIEDCDFIGNHADINGGAIEANTFAAELEITGSLFDSNTAGNGGAIYDNAQFGKCEIEHCRFEGNSADTGAAALWMQGGGDSSPPGSIDDAFFHNNTTADPDGAAVVVVVGIIQPLPTISGTQFCGSLPVDMVGEFIEGSDNSYFADCDCKADVNGDGELTPADFSAWVAAINALAPECDQNGDGLCNPADFSAWVANYNAGCP